MYFFQQAKLQQHASRILSLSVLISLSLLFSACNSASGQSQPVVSATRPVASITLSPTPSVPTLLRPDLERGMIYPQWGPSSYGDTDTTWLQGIKDIKAQTGATWLEIPVLLEQNTIYSTSVGAGPATPSVDAFASGVRSAVAAGYHVFFIPLLGVNTPGDWSGVVQISRPYQQVWFDSYWNALKPYAEAAQENGAEQMAIGTELVWLEDNAPASLWNQLIARVQSVFKGTLTYDMNWYPSLTEAPASWLRNPALAKIGLSEYVPLEDSPGRIDPNALPALWRNRVGKLIDAFSAQVGKQIILTEIGYADTSDGLSDPYYAQSTAPSDQAEQAAAYEAALSNVFADTRIAGIFFWGWSDVGRLGIEGHQAVQVVYRWYTARG
ncbi:MAG TPA: hypothetical protein VKV19_14235 [Ktedonobacteraceae bacterium]|nr:hypothetical protein [Ktedonobacteraceae bacterium]